MRWPRRRGPAETTSNALERSSAPTPIAQVESDAGGSPDGTQLAILLAAAAAAVDEQFKRAERLDAKARGQLTIVGAFFAFVQTITASTLRELHDHNGAATPALTPDSPQWMASVLLGVAVVAALCLFVALVKSAFAWQLRKELALSPQDISGWIRYATAGNPQVGIKLTQELAGIYKSRLDANESRCDALREAARWVVFTAAVVTVELVLALLFTVM